MGKSADKKIFYIGLIIYLWVFTGFSLWAAESSLRLAKKKDISHVVRIININNCQIFTQYLKNILKEIKIPSPELASSFCVLASPKGCPLEVWHNILQYGISYGDFCHLSLVCKDWHQWVMANKQVIHKYIVNFARDKIVNTFYDYASNSILKFRPTDALAETCLGTLNQVGAQKLFASGIFYLYLGQIAEKEEEPLPKQSIFGAIEYALNSLEDSPQKTKWLRLFDVEDILLSQEDVAMIGENFSFSNSWDEVEQANDIVKIILQKNPSSLVFDFEFMKTFHSFILSSFDEQDPIDFIMNELGLFSKKARINIEKFFDKVQGVFMKGLPPDEVQKLFTDKLPQAIKKRLCKTKVASMISNLQEIDEGLKENSLLHDNIPLLRERRIMIAKLTTYLVRLWLSSEQKTSRGS